MVRCSEENRVRRRTELRKYSGQKTQGGAHGQGQTVGQQADSVHEALEHTHTRAHRRAHTHTRTHAHMHTRTHVPTKPLQLCPTLCDPKDYTHQGPLSRRFSRQEYWRGLPCPPPGDLPDPRIRPMCLTSPTLTGRFFPAEPPGRPAGSNAGSNFRQVKSRSLGRPGHRLF